MTAESFPTPTFGSSIEYVNVLSSSSSLICFFVSGYKYIRCRLFFIFGPLASVYDGTKKKNRIHIDRHTLSGTGVTVSLLSFCLVLLLLLLDFRPI